MTENDVRENLNKLSKRIPNFIDAKNEAHYEIFAYISHIIKLYSYCCICDIIKPDRIDDLSIEYFSTLLRINKAELSIYRTAYDYLNEIYKKTLQQLNDNDLFEASHNLFNMVNPCIINDTLENYNDE